MTALLKPRLILSVIVVICSTIGLSLGHLTGSEWAGVVIASMWWTSAGGATTVQKSTEAL